MEIRFISSLTADDENSCAPILLKTLSTLLDQLPIAYTLRIETTGGMALQHSHVPHGSAEQVPGGIPVSRLIGALSSYGTRAGGA